MENSAVYIEKVLKHYYKKLAKLKKELKETEDIITVFEELKRGENKMTDYNAMLIDLLNDKIKQWEHKWNEQRKEINRLKAEIRELKKGVNTDEK